jgi:hypothetical protein
MFDAVIKNFLFIFEIDVQRCPGNTAAVGDFLEGGVLKTLVNKYVKGHF